MRRISKTIDVAGKKITFTEIPLNTIISLFRGESPIYEMPVTAALGELAGLIPLAIDCPLDELLDLEMYSDDTTAIIAAFKETNPAFFDLARRLDLLDALKTLLKAVIGAYCSNMLILPSVATALRLNTATDSSST